MTESGPVLRRRTSQDIKEIVRWIPDEEALYLFTGSQLTWPLTVEQLSAMEGSRGFSAWVVESPEGRLVAHFDLRVAEGARVGRIIVNPELRGQGWAAVVVGFAIDEARRQGVSRLGLNVIRGNEPAIRSYLRAGFSIDAAAPRPDVHGMTIELDRAEVGSSEE